MINSQLYDDMYTIDEKNTLTINNQCSSNKYGIDFIAIYICLINSKSREAEVVVYEVTF